MPLLKQFDLLKLDEKYDKKIRKIVMKLQGYTVFGHYFFKYFIMSYYLQASL